MTWADRLKPTIEMTSPDGDFFTPKWRGNPRNFVKKLGVFNYPRFAGSVVQDLNINGDNYALTLYFDGPDNDEESERFTTACKQTGTWEVDHPVKGVKLLQLIDLSEQIAPVESGGITVFVTNWIEPALEDELSISNVQLEDEILASLDIVNESAVSQFQQIKTNTFAAVAAVKAAIDRAVGFVTAATSAVSATVAAVEAQQQAIVRGIQDTLDAVVLDPLKLAGQMQNLVQLPGLVTSSVRARLDMYADIVTDMLGLSPDDDDTSIQALNTILTQELILTAVAAVTPVVGASGRYSIRSETLGAMNRISEIFDTIVNGLDAVQTNFSGTVFIENQYFSQSQSYNVALRATGLSNQLLIRKTFDLTLSRTLILKSPKTPARITLEEYGTLEEKLDLFISSNNLYGRDILWLPAGREVVIYG